MSPKDTRERILEVSARLFYEQGYNATGIATILREAKVNSGSLYHYFPSKEALRVGWLERYVELLRPEVTDGPERATDDPIERVFLLLANYRMGMEMTGCTMGCPIGNLALEVGDSYPDIRRLIDLNFSNVTEYPKLRVEKISDDNVPVLSEAVAKFVTAGVLHPRADDENTVRKIIGLPQVEKEELDALYDSANPTEDETLKDKLKAARKLKASLEGDLYGTANLAA